MIALHPQAFTLCRHCHRLNMIMHKALKTAFLVALVSTLGLTACQSTPSQDPWDYLLPLTDAEQGIGARPPGSEAEKQAANWIASQWQSMGYQVERQAFEFTLRNKPFSSENLFIDINGLGSETLVIAAHYDSTGEKQGSLGSIDNGSGVAALLALSAQLEGVTLPVNLRLVALGAEEVGLQGARAYVAQNADHTRQLSGMINLDTIIGGDKLYIHSAHTKPYACRGIDTPSFNADPKLRDALLALSAQLFGAQAHQRHAAFPGYPEGVTGGWSDHAPFACSGVPIAYLEATNFEIKGQRGNDGYSQTINSALWTCLDEKNLTACDRFKEKHWGMIWHTQFDRLDKLLPILDGRLQRQLEQNVKLLFEFVTRYSLEEK